MIRLAVSAVFLLRDGFTGLALTDGSAARCLLDGKPLRRPLWKQDGYLVLTGLAPGEHLLQISRRGYRDELVPILAEEGSVVEDTIALKPGAGYRFPAETVRVTLRLGPGAARIWLGSPLNSRLRVAQEKTESGDREAHLFCEGNASRLPIPGHFLLADKKAPELAYLRSLRSETGEFAPPLTLAHGRGTELVPMQSYDADESGTVQVLLREPGTLLGFAGGRVFEAQLQPGGQTLEWKLEG